MSSSTSSSKAHRRYVQGLLALILAPWSVLLALGVYLQPLYGDLTRIGSYAEKDFGWNKPQLEFQQPLSVIRRYDRYFDVVVLGDSFSTGRPRLHWQNYVVAATGWSVVTLDANEFTLEQILANRIFRQTPPKIFIFESIERDLPQRMSGKLPCVVTVSPTSVDSSPMPADATTSVHFGELRLLTKHVKRDTIWGEIKSGYVLSYLRNSLAHILDRDVVTDAPKVELSRQAPFSSINRKAMLVYKGDLLKVSWWRDMGISEIVCRIEAMHNRVEANGQTRFVLMVAPDKLTAYADFIHDSSLRDISALSHLADQLPRIMPRLDITLISAIEQGVQDVYLPDDTHWGSSGYQIAAETLITFLRR